jgi:hypothetical protein
MFIRGKEGNIMTRRDTILVAALINAGLLIVLFVSALKGTEESEKLVVKKEVPVPVHREIAPYSEPKKIAGDEVDLVLKQYTQPDPLQVPVVAEAPSVPNFVEDLQGIVQASPAVAAAQSPAPVPVPVVAGCIRKNCSSTSYNCCRDYEGEPPFFYSVKNWASA